MIDFTPLLTLQVSHDYYEGRCEDFAFFVPAPTARRLAGARCLAKSRDGVLTILCERNGAGDPLVDITGKAIRVGLRLSNVYFSNFTALPPALATGLPLYANSGADPAVLQPPVALQLDATHQEDAELLREGLFCLVQIQIAAAFYGTQPAFEVPFTAREERLKYYVVASNFSQAEFNQLTVADEGFGAESRPRIDFSRVLPPQFGADDLSAPMLGGDGARIAMFRSDQNVARRDRARKRIQLARNNDPIIAQLPQPGPADATATMVIHLSKP